MPFIPTIVEIRDANGVRIDRPNARNEQQPIVLKLSGGMTAESTDLGDGRTQVTINGGSGVVPEFTGYHGVGTAGKTDVSGLTATTYGALPFAFTASPSDQKVYTAIPVSLGPAALSLDGWGVDTTESVISVSGVDYRLLESVNLLTGTDLPFVVGSRLAEAGTTGDTGPAGPGYLGTSDTSLTFGEGSRTLSTQTGLAYVPRSRVKIVNQGDATQYMEGYVTSYGGNSLVFASDRYNGTGTVASWYLTIAGDVGQTGAAAASYNGTSTTSFTFGIGNKTWTTQAGLAFAEGDCVKITDADDGANWLHGSVTSYSSTSLAVNVTSRSPDEVGTINNWIIGLSGIAGPTGPTGPGYLATSATTYLPEGISGGVELTTQAGLAYAVGDYARATSRSVPTCWFEGPVESYSGTLLVITDATIGDGATEKSDWNISLRGQTGATGATGAAGEAGSIVDTESFVTSVYGVGSGGFGSWEFCRRHSAAITNVESNFISIGEDEFHGDNPLAGDIPGGITDQYQLATIIVEFMGYDSGGQFFFRKFRGFIMKGPYVSTTTDWSTALSLQHVRTDDIGDMMGGDVLARYTLTGTHNGTVNFYASIQPSSPTMSTFYRISIFGGGRSA